MRLIRKLSILFMIAGVSAGCGDSIQSVCERWCEKAEECDISTPDGSSPDRPEEVEICKASCDADQLASDLAVDEGDVTEECRDTFIEEQACYLDLSCSDLKDGSFGNCDDLTDDRLDACD